MKFGHFDDEKREYVITTPQTPYPWINYLGNEEFFSLIKESKNDCSLFLEEAIIFNVGKYVPRKKRERIRASIWEIN